MDPLTLGQLARHAGGTVEPGAASILARGLCTDSRAVVAGDLFACLSGPRFDGHDHLAEALQAGAVGALVSRPVDAAVPCVRVGDTLTALGSLGAALRRSNRDLAVVAVTGSNGKTSTKNLTAAALGAGMETVAAEQSFNNAVGVPLTLARVRSTTRALVVELGSNAPGEIAFLAELAAPTVGLITNVGPAHLSGLGSLSGVLEEKGSLLDHLEGDALAVLNRDDAAFERLAARARGPVLSFGWHERADLRASDLRYTRDGTCFRLDGAEVTLRLWGRHCVSNALAALACARALGVEGRVARAALKRVAPAPGRLQLRTVGELHLLDDSYNANPASLERALEALAELPLPGRRLFVVGDMLELGEEARRWHREAGERLGQARPALLVAVGRHAPVLAEAARAAGMAAEDCPVCEDAAGALAVLLERMRPGDLVFLKASRRVGLDQVAQGLAGAPAGVP